jgi:predicted peptidase
LYPWPEHNDADLAAWTASINHSDLFAESFVVAGQLPVEQVAPLAEKKLWVVVAQDDTKAYPGENAIMQVIKDKGTKVGTAVWDGQSPPPSLPRTCGI